MAVLNGRSALLWAAAALLLGGCGEEAGPGPAEERFSAILSSAAIVGNAPLSVASGSATFTWDGTRLRFELHGSRLDSLVGAHIHAPALPGQNNSIVLNLLNPANAITIADGEITRGAAVASSHLLSPDRLTLAEILDAMRTGRAYVLYHTARYPSGEIRGQIRAD